MPNYNPFIFDPERKKYKSDQARDIFRDFIYRNGIPYELLAEILGLEVKSCREHVYRGCIKFKDLVNIHYFCTRKGFKFPAIGETVLVYPSDEDKQRIDAIRLKWAWLKEDKNGR